MYMYVCDWPDSEMEDSPKSGEIARAAPSDVHDAQLSNGPIGASIRESEKCPFNNVNCSHLTAHTAFELRS